MRWLYISNPLFSEKCPALSSMVVAQESEKVSLAIRFYSSVSTVDTQNPFLEQSCIRLVSVVMLEGIQPLTRPKLLPLLAESSLQSFP